MEKHTINGKYRYSFKDEYDALFEAIFGEPSVDREFFGNTTHDKNNDLSNFAEDRAFHRKAKEPEIEEQELVDDFTWSQLPDLLLEQIFAHLTLQERCNAALVCKNWSNAFHLPNVWRTFVFDDKTLTRRTFNYYEGWEYKLDHVRVQLCLDSVGRHIRTLILKPSTIFRNVYEFMNYITFAAGQHLRGIGKQITRLQYTFPCNMASRNEETVLYGTGGELLNAIKKLMATLPCLRTLELEDLMLDPDESQRLLDQMCYTHCFNMRKLKLINISKTQCGLLHAGVFLNLHELVISPQNLTDSVLELLSETKLRHLHIVQNCYTPDTEHCSEKSWIRTRQNNSHLRVHLQVECKKHKNLLWQPGAPAQSVLFDSPQIRAKGDDIVITADLYSHTLRVFGFLSLTKYHQPKTFHDRIDTHLMYLCNRCPNLNTLVIREKISTATILFIANTARNLRQLYVRKNVVVLRPNLARNEFFTKDLYEWIRVNSRSYQTTEAEVSLLLGYKWKMLSDREFKNIRINMHI